MKLTLKQKQNAVSRFMAGESVRSICIFASPERDPSKVRADLPSTEEVQDAIRDFMNSKFKLEAKHEGS